MHRLVYIYKFLLNIIINRINWKKLMWADLESNNYGYERSNTVNNDTKLEMGREIVK